MNIGEFGAVAGNIAAGLQDYQDQRAIGNAQRAAAQAQQLELARAERLQNLRLGNPLADTSPYATLRMGPPLPLVEGEFPEQPPAAPPPAPGATPPAAAPPATRRAAAPAVAPTKAGLQTGVGGFVPVEPGASDARRAITEFGNERRLTNILGEISRETDVIAAGLRMPFVSQQRKGELQARETASDWYGSDAAKRYFTDYPQALEAARKNPLGFYKSLQQKNRERDATAKVPAAKAAAKAPATQAATEDLTQYANVPWSAVRDRIANIESVGYDTLAYDRGNRNLAGVRAPQPVTTMTIGQVLDFQRNQMRAATKGFRGSSDVGSTGVGRYQFESDTLEENAKKAFGKDYETVQFTPENQEVLAETLWNTVRGNPKRLAKTWGAFGGTGAGQVQTQPAGVDQTGGAQAPARRLAASDIINADPNALSLGIQQNLQMRDELVRQARLFQQAGLGNQYDQMRMQIMQLDNSMVGLQGAQGVQELLRYNDPSRIGAVYSLMDGGKNQIQFQRRNDGTFNMLANGKPVQQGLTKQQIVQDYMMATDASYRQGEIENRREQNKMLLETQLKIGETQASEVAKALAAIQVEGVKGGVQLMLKRMDMAGITPTIDQQNGGLWLTRKDGQGEAVFIKADVAMPNMPDIPPGPMATRVPGSRVVGPGSSG